MRSMRIASGLAGRSKSVSSSKSACPPSTRLKPQRRGLARAGSPIREWSPRRSPQLQQGSAEGWPTCASVKAPREGEAPGKILAR
eukprot:15116573-Alexandrium_andersonii.AAC.1